MDCVAYEHPKPTFTIVGRNRASFYRSSSRNCRRTYKPNFVEDDHSSRRGITANVHQRPTRRFPLHRPKPMKGPRGRTGPARNPRQLGQPGTSLPIWSCSVWGLPCLRALQPERCALTAPFHPYHRACARWRYLLCGTSRLCALTHRSRTLSGTLPCGVRTFLPRACTRQRPSSPPALSILEQTQGYCKVAKVRDVGFFLRKKPEQHRASHDT